MSTPQRKIYSLMIFVLIFDASEAFNFAVLKAPFFFSRIRSLTSLRLKKDTSAGSHAAIAAESEPSRVSTRISLPQALTGQGSHLSRETARPGPAPRGPPAEEEEDDEEDEGEEEALPAKRLSNAAAGPPLATPRGPAAEGGASSAPPAGPDEFPVPPGAAGASPAARGC